MTIQKITLSIDGIQVTANVDDTILAVANRLGINIPTICFHEACTANALCRICAVEVEGVRNLVPACVGKVADDMKVQTQTERVKRARRVILEMLASTVDLGDAPEIQNLLKEYHVDLCRFPEAKHRSFEILDDNPMYIREYSKCILCWRCVQVCAEDAQYTHAINFGLRGFETKISTFYDLPLPETTCVFCGQCIGVCPTGALKPKREWLLELGYSPFDIVQLTRTERERRTRREPRGTESET